MRKKKRDRLLDRGIWLLVVGVLTSWLLGLGLLFILAAAICGFVGLFRERVFGSAILLISSLAMGFVCSIVALHVAAIAGVYAFSQMKTDPAPPAVSVPQKQRGK